MSRLKFRIFLHLNSLAELICAPTELYLLPDNILATSELLSNFYLHNQVDHKEDTLLYTKWLG